MARLCPNCKKYNDSDAKFCEFCGSNIAGVKSDSTVDNRLGILDDFLEWFNQQSNVVKAGLGIGGICCIGIVLLLVFGGISPEQNTVQVQDVKVTASGFGSYDLSAIIIPNKDMDYLEMVLIWYDANGAVLDKNSLVWNINNPKAGQPYKATGTDYFSGSKPTKVEVLIYDTAFSHNDTKPIYQSMFTIS